MKFLTHIIVALSFVTLLRAQEILPSVSGRGANVRETGDAVRQHDFWLRPAPDARTAQAALFDAGLGGVADIVTGPADTRTVFELFPFDALYRYENGVLTALPASAVRPEAALTTLAEPQFVNRWFSFAPLAPARNGWVLRVRTTGGNDVNTFQVQVSDTASAASVRSDWSVLAVDLSIALVRLGSVSEVQIRPFGAFPSALTIAGAEDSDIGVRDEFGAYSSLPARREFFAPGPDGMKNSYGLVIGSPAQRINNLTVRGTNGPVLWELKPTVVRRPSKPPLTVLQLPGSSCSSVTFALSEETKRNAPGAVPVWLYNKKRYNGDSVQIDFGRPGTYGVTLLVPTRGVAFPKYWTERVAVTVNAPPTARITADRTVASPGDIITLSAAQSTDPEKAKLRYRWFVNGEYRSDEPALALSSLLPTVYDVRLIVNDGALNSSCTQDEASLSVRINAQPYAEIAFPQVFGRDEAVTFTVKSVTDNDNDTLRFSWSGPGISGGTKNRSVTVRHTEPGIYTMTLTANDRTGTTNSTYETTIAYRVNAEPVPRFAMTSMAAPGDTLDLNAFSSTDDDNPALSYSWRTDAGHSVEGGRARIAFREPGDYTVTLTADDGENVSNSVRSITRRIHINAPPVPLITANERSTAARQRMSAERTTDADDTRLRYRWNFGDGTSDSGRAVTHLYQKSGTYTIALTVDDQQGQTNSVRTVTHRLVINRYPTAAFTLPKEWEPFRPLAVDGRASTDPDGAVEEYTWLVNGRPVADGPTAELKFDEPGDYAVALKVKDDSGFDDAVGVKTLPVHVNYPPAVRWRMTPPVAEPGVPVTFDASASRDRETRTLRNVTWRFSDGTTASGVTVTRTFPRPGVIGVAAVVDDGQGFSNSAQSAEGNILVNSAPIVVTPTTIRSNSRRVLLDASASYDVDRHALEIEWLLPNRKRVNKASFAWDAPGGGVHFVTVTADDGQGKRNSVTRETVKILVNRPPVAVVDTLIASCTGRTILFNGSLSYDPDGDAVSTSWDFGDGATSTETNPAHAYALPGYYTVTLTLHDGFADRPTVATIPVVVQGSPVAVQSFADTTVCVNVPVSFSGTRSTDPNGPIGSYAWDFGDGVLSYGAAVSHAYTRPGTYYVTLTVIGSGSGSCSKVSQATSVVRVIQGPTADFAAPERVSPDEPVTFDPSASVPNGTVSSVVWRFGNDTTVTATSLAPVSHRFRTPGSYPVTLTIRITSASACNSAVITKTVQVNRSPSALLTVPADIALGDPLVLDGSRSSDADGVIAGYEWSVDGAPAGSAAVVSLSSLSAGTHHVVLRVTDNSGTSSRSAAAGAEVRVNSKPDPSFTLLSPLYENERLTLRADAATDADGDPLRLSWKLDGAPVQPDSLRPAPGRHVVTLIADDGRGLKNSIDSVRRELFISPAPSLDAPVPARWIAGTEFNAAELFASRTVSVITPQGPVPSVRTSADVRTMTVAWTPRGVPLATRNVPVTVLDSLRFTETPEPLTVEWNPSNPTMVLTAPPLNRAADAPVTLEWYRGTTLIAVGTVAEVRLANGANTFTLRARDQNAEGAHWTSVTLTIRCE